MSTVNINNGGYGSYKKDGSCHTFNNKSLPDIKGRGEGERDRCLPDSNFGWIVGWINKVDYA